MGFIRHMRVEEAREMAIMMGNAYPGSGIITNEAITKSEERLIRIQTTYAHAKQYGYYEDEEVLGGMRLYDYNMNMLGTEVQAGGVGSVAVNLLHKKEKIAKDLITYFINHYRDRGFPMVMLYPFRPDFYKQMGFGFGAKMNQYSLKPSVFPRYTTKEHLHFFKKGDENLIKDFYNSVYDMRHGMVQRPVVDWDFLLENLESKLVYYMKDAKVHGYMFFKFKRASETSMLKNNIVVTELLYDSREALYELLYFLNTQEDQIHRVIINITDEDFHYLFKDPRDEADNIFMPVYHETNIQGIGLMYRVINVPGLFELLKGHDFGNQNLKLALKIRDSLIPENSGTTLLKFEDGMPQLMENGEPDVEITMDISDFSSLIMGTVSFKSLVRLGIADISDDKYLSQVDKLFHTEEIPQCLVAF